MTMFRVHGNDLRIELALAIGKAMKIKRPKCAGRSVVLDDEVTNAMVDELLRVVDSDHSCVVRTEPNNFRSRDKFGEQVPWPAPLDRHRRPYEGIQMDLPMNEETKPDPWADRRLVG